MALTIHYHPLSQPSRSIVLFARCAGIEAKEVVVDLPHGGTHTPEYLAMNPFHSVPVVDDGGLYVIESVAEAKYLANSRDVADNWYPKDPKKRARVDEYLAWQHTAMRAAGVKVAMAFAFTKVFTGEDATDEARTESLKLFDEKLGQFESYFLKDKPFIVGDEISIADIFAVSEIEQSVVSKKDYLKGHDKTKAWIQRVKSKTNPHYDDIFKAINGFAASL